MTQDRDVFRLDGRSALVTGAGGVGGRSPAPLAAGPLCW
jgi:hypothetical protein